MPIALGLETSCDDTSVSLVKETGEVLFLKKQTQDSTHKKYGGIVPELASRNHSFHLLPLIEEALEQVPPEKIQVIGVTNRPGLLGSLLVGCMTAKVLSMIWDKPLVGVNHIESHIFSSYLWQTQKIPAHHLPALALVVSGGHTCLFHVKGVGDSILLGSTLDDAAGEALDKFAKSLGFSWPGAYQIDIHSQKSRFDLNVFSKIKTQGLSFSFSGIKSSGRRFLESKSSSWIQEHLPEICAAYQEVVMNHLMDKLEKAYEQYPENSLLIGGGVSANSLLKSRILDWTQKNSIKCLYPEAVYCTDNAAMVAFTALKYFLKGETSSLDLACYPRFLENDFFVLPQQS